MKTHAILFIAALFFIIGSSIANADPFLNPLLQQTDVQYLGRITASDLQADGLKYGGRGAGVDGSTLYLGCSKILDQMASITMNEPSLDPDWASIQKSQVATPCADVTNNTINTELINDAEIRGSMVYDGKLLMSAHEYYGCNLIPNTSRSSLVLDAFEGWDTMVDNLNTKPRGLSGYLGHIPAEWQPEFGASAFVGWGGGPTATDCSSFGFSFTAFDPSTLYGNFVGETLAFFPDQQGVVEQELYNWLQSTLTVGAAIPSGTSTALFVMNQGETQCYGKGTDDPALDGTLVDPSGDVIYCYDPARVGVKGVHSYPYHVYLIAVDVRELLAVKAGTKLPNEVVYYGKWLLPEIDEGGAIELLSATYDDGSGRLYIVPKYEAKPTIYVYQINRLSPYERCLLGCESLNVN